MKSLPILFLLSFPLLALAQNVPQAPHLVADGEYQAEAVPDLLRMELSINEIGEDVAVARTAVDARSARLIQAVKALGIAKEDITASKLQVTPHYNWNNREQVLVATEVARTIQLVLRDLQRYEDLINAIMVAQVGRINSTILGSSKEAALRSEAVQGAINNARHRAEQMAAGLGVKLGRVYAISSPGAAPVLAEAAYRLKAGAQGEAFEPGTLGIREAVRVVYYLSEAE